MVEFFSQYNDVGIIGLRIFLLVKFANKKTLVARGQEWIIVVVVVLL